MSDLQRSFAKAKLTNLPFNPPAPLNALGEDLSYFDEIEEEADDGLRPLPSPSGSTLEDDSSSASSASSTGTIVPSPGRKLFARGKGYAMLPFSLPGVCSIYFQIRTLFAKWMAMAWLEINLHVLR